MPRKVKPDTAADTQKQRARNYSYYFDLRARLKTLPVELQEAYARVRKCLPMPGLKIWGNSDWDDETYNMMYRVGRQNGLLDQEFLDPFISDEGWEIFQELWKNLPEPIDFVHTVEDKYGLFKKREGDYIKRR